MTDGPLSIPIHSGRYARPLDGDWLGVLDCIGADWRILHEGQTVTALQIRPDGHHPERRWRREIRLSVNGQIELRTSTACLVPRLSLAPPFPDLPACVRQILCRNAWHDAGLPVCARPHDVRTEEDVRGLVRALRDPARALPIILISEPLRADPAALALRLLGTAHVMHIRPEAAHLLSCGIGRRWSAWNGAIRSFAVPFADEDPQERHPLALAQNARAREDGTAFEDLLVRRAFRMGLEPVGGEGGVAGAAAQIDAVRIPETADLDAMLARHLRAIAEIKRLYRERLDRNP